MTRKERWLAALNGEEMDRLVFWPKIFNSSYTRYQAVPFSNMSIREILDYANTDNQLDLPSYINYDYGKCSYNQSLKMDF